MRVRHAVLFVLLVAPAVAAQQPPVIVAPGVRIGPPVVPGPPPWVPPPVIQVPRPNPFPVHLFIPWWLVIVVVIAQQQRKIQEEEEEVTTPTATEYEYKFLRSQFGIFKKPEKFRAALAEEARCGWELVEKFDDSRVRLRRPVSCRAQDADSGQDPYRTRVGAGEGAMVAWIVLAVVLGIAAVFGVLFLVLGWR